MDPKDKSTDTEETNTETQDESTEETADGDGGKASDQDGSDSDSNDEADDEAADETNESLFFDPAQLPKELQGAFKRMQAKYTQKMQGISMLARKSEAYDALISHPGFKKWLSAQTGESSGDDTEDTTPSKKGAAKEPMEAMMEKVVARVVGQMLNARDNHLSQKDQIIKDAEEFKKNNPEWVNYKDEMLPYIERGFTFEEAFTQASKGDLIKIARKKMVTTLTDKKNANTNRTSSNSVRESADGKVDSFEDAVALAKKQLGYKS